MTFLTLSKLTRCRGERALARSAAPTVATAPHSPIPSDASGMSGMDGSECEWCCGSSLEGTAGAGFVSECACDEALLATLAERACRVAARAAVLLPPPACFVLLVALAVELGVGDRSAALETPVTLAKPERGRRDGLRLTRTVLSSSSDTGFFSSKLGRGRDLPGGGPVPGAAGLKREKSDFMAGALGLCGDRLGGRKGRRDSRRGRQRAEWRMMERRKRDDRNKRVVSRGWWFDGSCVVICCFGLLWCPRSRGNGKCESYGFG